MSPVSCLSHLSFTQEAGSSTPYWCIQARHICQPLLALDLPSIRFHSWSILPTFGEVMTNQSPSFFSHDFLKLYHIFVQLSLFQAQEPQVHTCSMYGSCCNFICYFNCYWVVSWFPSSYTSYSFQTFPVVMVDGGHLRKFWLGVSPHLWRTTYSCLLLNLPRASFIWYSPFLVLEKSEEWVDLKKYVHCIKLSFILLSCLIS